MQVFFSNRTEIFKMFAEIAKKDTQTPYKGGQNTNYSVLAPEATCKIQRASTAFTLPSPLTSAAAVWAASKVRTPLAACSTQRASTALILSSPFRSPRRRPLQTGRRDADPYKRGAESSPPTLALHFYFSIGTVRPFPTVVGAIHESPVKFDVFCPSVTRFARATSPTSGAVCGTVRPLPTK